MSAVSKDTPKIGFCLLSWASDCATLPLNFFRTLRSVGFDGVEIPIVHSERANVVKIARLLDTAGLRRTALTVMPPGTNPVSESAEERQAAKARIAGALELTRELGAELLVGPIHQTLGAFTGSAASTIELERLADFHRYAGDLAEKFGAAIAFEPMVRFECHMFNRFDDVAEYLDRLDHPSVRGLFDTFHANVEEADPVAALQRNMRRVGHFHVSETDRGVPGRGHAPWPAYFQVLRNAGYSGWVTAEVFGRGDLEFAGRARVWRDLPGTVEQVAAETFAHIRNGWEAATPS